MSQVALVQPESEEEEAKWDFDIPFQRKIVALFMRDTIFAQKTVDLIEPEYLAEDSAKVLVRMLKDHVRTYKSTPDMRILPTLLKDEIANKRIRADQVPDLRALIRDAAQADLSNSDFVVSRVRDFAKHRATEQAMLESLNLLEKGKFAEIEQVMKKAFAVGASNGGDRYNYWAEIENRTQERIDFNNGKIVRRGITTGYPALDAYLYHLGWGRRELSCMMGAAKAGKSLSLGDFSKNASMAGFNVFYGSLEVSAKIIAARLDAAVSDTLIRELHKDPHLVKSRIDAIARNSGAFELRDFASGTLKPSTLHRTLEEYRADGIIFDLVTVDYADIMAAEYRSDSLQDNLREIYIDLRAIAHELDVALLTATQTNRDGAKAATAKATDVGDDWNKARTVDILIGINATDAEKAAGEARLYWALSRNTEDGFSIKIKQDRQKMKFLTSVIGRI